MDFTRGKMGGGLPVERKPSHELTQSLRHVVAELRSAYPSRILSDEIAFDGPVYCDTRRIAQLLSNLVVNAIVHGHPTEPIFIFADNHGGGMRISVLNRSVLIAPETISRLFQPFWRGQGRSKSAGLGLGLYIASAIAKSHGGVLSVDSDITRTVFTFAIAPAGS